MSIHPVQSWDDPLLNPYRNMKDKELARDGCRFIAEGQQVVMRLLRSGIEVESVLVARGKLSAIESLAGKTTVLSAPDDVIEKVIGFEFHSGVLACGLRPKSPQLKGLIPPNPTPVFLVIVQEITNAENIGSLIRTSAALGADAMIIGERCCDPFFRQSVRVSMGAVFTLPMIHSENLLDDLEFLKSADVKTIATSLDEKAGNLATFQCPDRSAILFGSEAQGLDFATLANCEARITIPMQRGTDSLNVGIAAGIVLYSCAISRARAQGRTCEL